MASSPCNLSCWWDVKHKHNNDIKWMNCSCNHEVKKKVICCYLVQNPRADKIIKPHPDLRIELSLTFSDRRLNNTNVDQSAVTLWCNIISKNAPFYNPDQSSYHTSTIINFWKASHHETFLLLPRVERMT